MRVCRDERVQDICIYICTLKAVILGSTSPYISTTLSHAPSPPPSFTPSPAVLFHDAVLFGLSHETAFTETSFLSKYSFPFATTERTVSCA